jgi:hypothetical protein
MVLESHFGISFILIRLYIRTDKFLIYGINCVATVFWGV